MKARALGAYGEVTFTGAKYNDFESHQLLVSANEWFHKRWRVVVYNGKPISTEFERDFRLLLAASNFVVKLMLITDLTDPHQLFP